MLATRFQPRLQTASARRARPAGRTAALWVVAFKNGDEEQQAVQQAVSKAKVTFQLPLHGKQQLLCSLWHHGCGGCSACTLVLLGCGCVLCS